MQSAISSGALKGGDRLPSAHELSERLGVNFNTIGKAYRDREIMGLLYSRRGMGVFVNKDIESKGREAYRKRIIERLHEVVGEAKAAGMTSNDVMAIIQKSLKCNVIPTEKVPMRTTRKTAPAKKKKAK